MLQLLYFYFIYLFIYTIKRIKSKKMEDDIRMADEQYEDVLVDNNITSVDENYFKEMNSINISKLLTDFQLTDDDGIPSSIRLQSMIVAFKRETQVTNNKTALRFLEECLYDVQKAINKHNSKKRVLHYDSDYEGGGKSSSDSEEVYKKSKLGVKTRKRNRKDNIKLKAKTMIIRVEEESKQPVTSIDSITMKQQLFSIQSEQLYSTLLKDITDLLPPMDWNLTEEDLQVKLKHMNILMDTNHIYPRPIVFKVCLTRKLSLASTDYLETEVEYYFYEKTQQQNHYMMQNQNLSIGLRKQGRASSITIPLSPNDTYKFLFDNNPNETNCCPSGFFDGYLTNNFQFHPIQYKQIKTISAFQVTAYLQCLVGIPIQGMNTHIQKNEWELTRFLVYAGLYPPYEDGLCGISMKAYRIQQLLEQKANIVDTIIPTYSLTDVNSITKCLKSAISRRSAHTWFMNSVYDMYSHSYKLYSPHLGKFITNPMLPSRTGKIIFTQTSSSILPRLLHIYNTHTQYHNIKPKVKVGSSVILLIGESWNISYFQATIQQQFAQSKIVHLTPYTTQDQLLGSDSDDTTITFWLLSTSLLQEYSVLDEKPIIITAKKTKQQQQAVNSKKQNVLKKMLDCIVANRAHIISTIFYHVQDQDIPSTLQIDSLLSWTIKAPSVWWITSPLPFSEFYTLQPIWQTFWYGCDFMAPDKFASFSYWKEDFTNPTFNISSLVFGNTRRKLWLFDFVQHMCMHVEAINVNQPIECHLSVQHIELNTPEMQEIYSYLMKHAIEEYKASNRKGISLLHTKQVLQSCSYTLAKMEKLQLQQQSMMIDDNHQDTQLYIQDQEFMNKIQPYNDTYTDLDSIFHSIYNDFRYRLLENECPSCGDAFSEETNKPMQTICGHFFCFHCLVRWKVECEQKAKKGLLDFIHMDQEENEKYEYLDTKAFEYNLHNKCFRDFTCPLCRASVLDLFFQADMWSLIQRYKTITPVDRQLQKLQTSCPIVPIDKFPYLPDKIISVMPKHQQILSWYQYQVNMKTGCYLLMASAHADTVREIYEFLHMDLGMSNIFCMDNIYDYQALKDFESCRSTSDCPAVLITLHQPIQYPTLETCRISNVLLIDPCIYPYTLSAFIRPWKVASEDWIVPVTVLVTENTIESRLFDVERRYESHYPIVAHYNHEGNGILGCKLTSKRTSTKRYTMKQSSSSSSSSSNSNSNSNSNSSRDKSYTLLELNYIYLKSSLSS